MRPYEALLLLGFALYCGAYEKYFRFPVVYRKGKGEDHLLTVHDIRGRLKNVYENKYPIFTYHDTDLETIFSNFPAPVALVSVDSPALICSNGEQTTPSDIDEADLEPENVFHYYSGEIGNVEFDPSKEVLRIFRDDSAPHDYSVNIWIGGKDIHVTPHYDGVHNLFYQHQGTKQVVLAPPVESDKAALFGKLHPLARQSRWQDMRGPSPEILAEKYSLRNQSIIPGQTAKASALRLQGTGVPAYMEVTLHPGDILYIPPYWLHQTLAESCSVSVSVWWDPVERDAVSELMDMPIPLEMDYSLPDFIAGGTSYLAHFLACIGESLSSYSHSSKHQPNTQDFVHQMLLHRYFEDFRLNRLRGSPKSNVFLVDAKVKQYARKSAEALVSHVDSRIKEEAKGSSILSRVHVADDAKWERISWVGQLERDDATLKADDIIAIVTLKALDYAEEVALFIAEHVLAHSVTTQPTKAESSALAVQYLQQTLQGMEYLKQQDSAGRKPTHQEL